MTEQQHAALDEGASDSSEFIIIEKAALESDEGDVNESGERGSGEENDDETAASGSVVDQYFEADEQHPKEQSRVKRAPLQRHDASCSLCQEDIRGERWLCLECSGWSLCSECFHSLAEEVHPRHTFVRARSVDDIYKPASASGRKEAPVVHLDVLCSSCQTPILGSRYECIANECQEGTSFCEACERHSLTTHDPTHPMVVFKMPCERSAPSLRLSDTTWAKEREVAQFARKNRPFNYTSDKSSKKGLWDTDYYKGPSTKIEKKKQQRKSPREYCMEVRLDKENSWGSTVKPGATFNRSWDVANIGTLPWAKGTAIVRVSPAVFSPILFSQRLISDDVVVAGRTIEVRFIGFQAPKEEGTYTEVWALSTCDGRLFGERLEIQLTVGTGGDQSTSDRYHSLKRALKDVPQALRLVKEEEKNDDAADHLQKFPIRSSTLHWDGIEQTFTCSWQLKEDPLRSKSKLSAHNRLKRLHRVGHTKEMLQIDDADCVVSLSSTTNGRVEIGNLKIATPQKPSEDPSPMTSTGPAVVWFDEVWTLVDKQGVEVGQRFSISHSFLCADVQERGESKKRLLPHMPLQMLEEEEQEETYSAMTIRSSRGKCLAIEVQYH